MANAFEACIIYMTVTYKKKDLLFTVKGKKRKCSTPLMLRQLFKLYISKRFAMQLRRSDSDVPDGDINKLEELLDTHDSEKAPPLSDEQVKQKEDDLQEAAVALRKYVEQGRVFPTPPT